VSAKQRIDGASAFLLHAYPYSETSLVVDVFSRDHGRLPLLARGARRPRSALRGTLIGFQLLELGWFGSGEVKTLAKAEWCGGTPLLQGRCLLLGYYLNELLLKLLPREDAHADLFESYADAVGALANGAADAPELRRFEKSLLREIGYGLTLAQDADGAPVQAGQRYRYFVERGLIAVEGEKFGEGLTLAGKTLLDMDADDYRDPRTLAESKLLMRQLVAHQLGDKLLQSRRVFVDLQEL
jgi:DNA repair protein RecO (recombination protein O)